MKGISVIIACFNSEKVIGLTLRHLQAQINTEGIDWEIILVNNNSTDRTSEVAKEIWDENPLVTLKIVLEEKVGEANARQTGIKAAKYDILSIVDDDNWVSNNWIKTVNSYFKNPKIGLLGCEGVGEFEKTPPAWFEENKNAFAIGSLYEGDFTDITNHALVPGAGLCVRKKVYEKLFEINWKPFLQGRIGDKQSAGADSEMCYITRLLGYSIYYSNQLKFKHYTANHRITWDRLKRMTEGFGEADVFTLPYKILYGEHTGKKSIINNLRKHWWFNYIGKKLSLWSKDPFQFIQAQELSQKQLIRIRNNAFCKTIWREREKFESSFAYLQKLKEYNTLNK
jgi:glycosyltransferase involved in cell wall biosynthesis